MKKIIALILVLTCLFSLFSCGDREYDEAVVKEEAKTLIEASVLLNEVLWGKGIAYSEDKNTSNGVYYEAVFAAHYQMGFKTLSELKSMIQKTFSSDYCQHIFKTVMSSNADENYMTRYYQKYSSADGTTPEAIMVNSEWMPLLVDEVTYYTDTIEVIGSKKQLIYVTVNASVKREGVGTQATVLTIALIEEKEGFRLDSPTYLSYDTTKQK